MGSGRVPVFHAGRALDDISFMNNLNRLASFLIVPSAFGDQQYLATRMDMPIQPCAGTIGCQGNAGVKRAIAHVELVQPDFPDVIFDDRQFAPWKGRAARLRSELLAHMSPVDLVLVEGFKRERHPKIEIHRAANAKPLLYPDDASIIAVASDVALPGLALPLHHLDDIEAIADTVQSRAIEWPSPRNS